MPLDLSLNAACGCPWNGGNAKKQSCNFQDVFKSLQDLTTMPWDDIIEKHKIPETRKIFIKKLREHKFSELYYPHTQVPYSDIMIHVALQHPDLEAREIMLHHCAIKLGMDSDKTIQAFYKRISEVWKTQDLRGVMRAVIKVYLQRDNTMLGFKEKCAKELLPYTFNFNTPESELAIFTKEERLTLKDYVKDVGMEYLAKAIGPPRDTENDSNHDQDDSVNDSTQDTENDSNHDQDDSVDESISTYSPRSVIANSNSSSDTASEVSPMACDDGNTITDIASTGNKLIITFLMPVTLRPFASDSNQKLGSLLPL